MIGDHNAKVWKSNYTYNYTVFFLSYQGFCCLISFCNKSDIYYYWNKEILCLCCLGNAILKGKSSFKTKKINQNKKESFTEMCTKSGSIISVVGKSAAGIMEPLLL